MSRYRIFAYLALAVGIGLSSGCRAETKSVTDARLSADQAARRHGAVNAVMGLWNVAGESGQGGCLIALNATPRGSDFGVHIETCTLKALASVAAWRPTEDGFELVRTDGAPGRAFRQTGVDSFESRDGALKVTRAAVP